jgi:hypothetical protein
MTVCPHNPVVPGDEFEAGGYLRYDPERKHYEFYEFSSGVQN